MINRIQARRRRGFSLIEILVAVLLIGILMAVALPRLLGSREAANDSAAQQQIAAVQQAAMAQFTSRENFKTSDAATLQDKIKEVPLTTGAASTAADTTLVGGNDGGDSNARAVSIAVNATGTEWTAAALGGNSICWFVKLSTTEADQFAYSEGNTACDANNAPAAGDAAWQQYGFPDAP